jgi:hypothetical protein
MIESFYKVYKTHEPPVYNLLLADPVRPHIYILDRFALNREVIVGYEDEGLIKPTAVCCVAWLDYIPAFEEELFYTDNRIHDVAVMYSIWSLQNGGATNLVHLMLPYFKYRYAKRVMTLSPKTEMAKNFHLKNGAIIYRENETSINYEYEL